MSNGWLDQSSQLSMVASQKQLGSCPIRHLNVTGDLDPVSEPEDCLDDMSVKIVDRERGEDLCILFGTVCCLIQDVDS
jgi:hypothetical protein